MSDSSTIAAGKPIEQPVNRRVKMQYVRWIQSLLEVLKMHSVLVHLSNPSQ